MSVLLRSMLVLGVTGLLMAGCGKEEEVAVVEEAPAPVTAPAAVAPAAEAAPATGGGYEPTADERVPGITIDPAVLAAEAAAAGGSAEVAPVTK